MSAVEYKCGGAMLDRCLLCYYWLLYSCGKMKH